MDDDKFGSEPDYEIGYKRPPRASQFKPGQSGNPPGKARGSARFAAELEEWGNKTVAEEDGRKVTAFEFVARKLWKRAGDGDLKAAKLIIDVLSRSTPLETLGERITFTLQLEDQEDSDERINK